MMRCSLTGLSLLLGLAAAADPVPRSLLHNSVSHSSRSLSRRVETDGMMKRLAAGSDFVCPLELPIGEGDDKKNQEVYFDALHEVILDGNKVFDGIEDETFKEHYWKEYKKEVKCIFATYLDDKQKGGPCGGMKSRFDVRQKQWEKICLDGEKDVVDVYDMVTPDERTLFFRIKSLMKETAAFDTYLSLAGEKEVMCMQIKMIDDECAAMKKPRMLPPSEAKKLAPPKEEDEKKEK